MTALQINKDHTVTIYENIDRTEIENLNNEDIVLYEDAIDWDYGY